MCCTNVDAELHSDIEVGGKNQALNTNDSMSNESLSNYRLPTEWKTCRRGSPKGIPYSAKIVIPGWALPLPKSASTKMASRTCMHPRALMLVYRRSKENNAGGIYTLNITARAEYEEPCTTYLSQYWRYLCKLCCHTMHTRFNIISRIPPDKYTVNILQIIV